MLTPVPPQGERTVEGGAAVLTRVLRPMLVERARRRGLDAPSAAAFADREIAIAATLWHRGHRTDVRSLEVKVARDSGSADLAARFADGAAPAAGTDAAAETGSTDAPSVAGASGDEGTEVSEIVVTAPSNEGSYVGGAELDQAARGYESNVRVARQAAIDFEGDLPRASLVDTGADTTEDVALAITLEGARTPAGKRRETREPAERSGVGEQRRTERRRADAEANALADKDTREQSVADSRARAARGEIEASVTRGAGSQAIGIAIDKA